jgi:hypothetical protein
MLMDNADHRRDAVGRAGSGRDYVVLLGLVEMIVDPHDHVQGPVLHRSRDDDLPDAAVQVGGEHPARLEPAGALHHHVDPELAPGRVLQALI